MARPSSPPALDSSPPMDRRQRKSRAALERSLLHLIAFKPYDEITIEDVSEAADVARATFYAHFKDKAALLRAANLRLIGELAERARQAAPLDAPIYTGAGIIAIFRHASEHEDLYRLILSGQGGAEPRAQLVHAFRGAVGALFARWSQRDKPNPQPPTPLTTDAFVGALLLTLESWLTGQLDGEPDELARTFIVQQVKGLEWSLGFEPGTWVFQPESDERPTHR